MIPYLGIKKTYIDDRLTVEFHIEPQTGTFLVSYSLLQRLVENLIKYVTSQSPNVSLIKVTDKCQHDCAQVEVIDNRRIQYAKSGAKSRTALSQNGVGGQSLFFRLNAQYPDNHSFNTICSLNVGDQE